jgi:hypothetical protein
MSVCCEKKEEYARLLQYSSLLLALTRFEFSSRTHIILFLQSNRKLSTMPSILKFLVKRPPEKIIAGIGTDHASAGGYIATHILDVINDVSHVKEDHVDEIEQRLILMIQLSSQRTR